MEGDAHRTWMKSGGPWFGEFILPNSLGGTTSAFSKFRVRDLALVDTYDGEDWEDGTDVQITFGTSNGSEQHVGFFDGRNNSICSRLTSTSTRLGWLRLFLDRQTDTDPAVGDIIKDVCEKAGIDPTTEVDVTDLSGLTVPGYTISEVSTGRKMLVPLQQMLNIDGVESDGKLKFRQRGDTSADHTILDVDLGVGKRPKRFRDKLIQIDKDESELPLRVDFVHYDPARDYQEGAQYDKRNQFKSATATARQNQKIETPISIDATAAKQAASRQLYAQHANATKLLFQVGPKFLTMEPTDLASITHDGRTLFARIDKVKLGESLLMAVEAVLEEPSVYSSLQVGDGNPGNLLFGSARTVSVPGFTETLIADIPLLRDQDDTSDLSSGNVQPVLYVWMAGVETDWRGAILSRSDTGADPFNQIQINQIDFGWGKILGAIGSYSAQAEDVNATGGAIRAAGNIRTFESDEGEITVQVIRGSGELATVTQLDILNGQNAALIGRPGAWEVIQFMTVVDNGDGTFTLTGLNRGLRGTEAQAETGHIAGAFFIQIKELAVNLQRFDLDEIGNEIFFRADTIGSTVIEGSPVSTTLIGNSLEPYSPALVSCGMDRTTKDITLIWVRRTRIGGEEDWRDLVTGVPLGEAAETYSVDVLDSSDNVVETIANASVDITTDPNRPRITYTSAQQAAAGLGVGFPTTFKIYQISSTTEIGRGFPLTVICVPDLIESPDSLSGGGVDLVWLDGADTDTQTVVADQLTDWVDKSTAGSDFDQGTGSARPGTLLTLNGRRVIDFDGGDFLERAANLTGAEPMTWIILANKSAAGGGDDVMFESEQFRLKSRNANSDAIELQRGGLATNLLNGGTDRITMASAYRVVICQFEDVGGTDMMRMQIGGAEVLSKREALAIDPQGDANDRFVASASETNWSVLGFNAGMDVTGSDFPVADTGTITIEATEGGGTGGRDQYVRADGGSFLTDGFLVGMGLIVTGFSGGGVNNQSRGQSTGTDRTIFAVDATTITIDSGGDQAHDLDNEGPVAGCRILYDNNVLFQDIDSVSTTVLTVDVALDTVLEGPNTLATGTLTAVSPGNVPIAATSNSTGTAIGRDFSTGGLGHLGNIAEFMAFGRILTAQEILDMRIYLFDKWGVL